MRVVVLSDDDFQTPIIKKVCRRLPSSNDLILDDIIIFTVM